MAITISRDAPAWAQRFADDVSRELRTSGRGFPVAMASFPKADLPDAARWASCWIWVPDATGGAVPAYSDGTDWLRPNSTVID